MERQRRSQGRYVGKRAAGRATIVIHLFVQIPGYNHLMLTFIAGHDDGIVLPAWRGAAVH